MLKRLKSLFAKKPNQKSGVMYTVLGFDVEQVFSPSGQESKGFVAKVRRSKSNGGNLAFVYSHALNEIHGLLQEEVKQGSVAA